MTALYFILIFWVIGALGTFYLHTRQAESQLKDSLRKLEELSSSREEARVGGNTDFVDRAGELIERTEKEISRLKEVLEPPTYEDLLFWGIQWPKLFTKLNFFSRSTTTFAF